MSGHFATRFRPRLASQNPGKVRPTEASSLREMLKLSSDAPDEGGS